VRRLRLAAALVVASVLALAAGAAADTIVSSASSVEVPVGESRTVSFTVQPDGDGVDVCNLDGTSVGVSLAADGPIQLSTASLSFTACGVSQEIVVTAPPGTAPGTYTVTPSVGDPGYDASPGVVSVVVPVPAPPPDTTAPVLTLPGNLAAEATSAAGAVVTYTASAVDDISGAVAVSCTPPSGSAFPIGTSPVSCSAQDAAGNVATGGFNVTVADTVAPVVTIPSSAITAAATGPTGAVVTFSASATDAVSGAITPTCAPASGSTFPVGTTTVTCTAADAAGNNGSAAFSVVVTDAGPTIVVPPTQTLEALGPAGSRVTFTPAPTASDVVDGPLPVTCTPDSGALFPVGTTTVTCTAADSRGNSASASFLVAVVDTTPPVVTAPPPATFVSESGGPLARSSSALAAYLARGRASDLVTPQPILYVDAPDPFPLGPTVVHYIAVDASGNRADATTTITIVPPPPPGQPRPPAPPPDDPPPGNVTALRVVRGNGFLRLSWTAPRDPDVARYAAFRSERTGPLVQVYSGTATSFTDRGLVNGVEYRYVVVAYDRAGNRSAGVAVLGTPRVPMLVAPRDGARLARGTVFSWRRAPAARYYNFQLFLQRPGAVGNAPRLQKVLSAWPATNRFRLGAKWKFGRRTYRLVPGTYRWFVWPGFGARRDARYGELLGERSFVVVRRRR
jgi:hypothetical protein